MDVCFSSTLKNTSCQREHDVMETVKFKLVIIYNIIREGKQNSSKETDWGVDSCSGSCQHSTEYNAAT